VDDQGIGVSIPRRDKRFSPLHSVQVALKPTHVPVTGGFFCGGEVARCSSLKFVSI
jgi:hypothetical protein